MKPGNQKIATLITMRLSHYCEKARWGLDRLEFPYREEAHAPLVHRIFTTRNKGSTVPMLVHRAQSLTDSAEILAYIDSVRGGGHFYPRDGALMIPVIMPIARLLIRRGYRITVDRAARSLNRVDNVFRLIEARLRDGRTYLVGDRFTAADLTFASLAAPALFPSECRAALPTLEMVPSIMKDQVARFRETAAGKFAMDLYQRERSITIGGPQSEA